MLVEFSPWETTDTSLRLSISKRKRPRGGLSSSSSVCEDEFPIAGSFITTKTGRRKQRNSPDGSRAVLAITSPYRVSVLVSKNKGSATGAPKTEALDAADSLHESARLQYSCRPGKKASFLPNVDQASSSSKPSKTNKIAVVFDSKHDRFWALQNGNKRLVVWDAQSEGPDQKGSKGGHNLEEAVVSLDVLPNGVVVGSTSSGSIYYASVDKESSTIHVGYIALPDMKDINLQGAAHAGTFVCFDEAPSNTTGTKRKSSHGSECETIGLYQIFVNGSTATIIQHDLIPSGDNHLSMERRKHKVASLSLCPPGTDDLSASIHEAIVVRTTIGNPNTILLCYHVKTESSANKQYCCTIQLRSATLAQSPFRLNCVPQRISLINPKILAMGVKDKILLCDAGSGVVFHEEPLPFSLEDDADDFMLLSDARKGLLVALFRSGEHLNASTTTLRVEDEAADLAHPSTSQLSLAARVSASLGVGKPTEKEDEQPKRITLHANAESMGEVKTVDMKLGEAIQLIQEAESQIRQKQGKGYTKGRLVNVFRQSFVNLNHSPIVLKHCPTFDLFHTSPDFEKKSARRKGSSDDTTPRKDRQEGASINGRHDRTTTPTATNGEKVSHNATTHEMDAFEVTPSDTSVDGHPHDAVAKKKESEDGQLDASDAADIHASSEPIDGPFPLAFVDAVTPIICRILFYVASTAKAPHDEANLIKEDCCRVLHSLASGGNVSVRKHFDHHPGDEQWGRDFMSLLLCMKCKQTKQRRLRSPVDFILDVLQQCADVSESHMVTMMHFMLCHSNPIDIALALLDSRALPADHPSKLLSSRYLAELSEPGDDTALERTKGKLVIAGSGAVLEKILRYSHCNQALLSVALRETFSFGQEIQLLCRLLSDVAFPQARARTLDDNGSGNLMASATRWIPALVDASSHIGGLSEEGDLEHLVHLHKSLTMFRLQTEQLLKLERKMNESALKIAEEEEAEEEKQGSHTGKRRRIQADDTALPGYSVERLVL